MRFAKHLVDDLKGFWNSDGVYHETVWAAFQFMVRLPNVFFGTWVKLWKLDRQERMFERNFGFFYHYPFHTIRTQKQRLFNEHEFPAMRGWLDRHVHPKVFSTSFDNLLRVKAHFVSWDSRNIRRTLSVRLLTEVQLSTMMHFAVNLSFLKFFANDYFQFLGGLENHGGLLRKVKCMTF